MGIHIINNFFLQFDSIPCYIFGRWSKQDIGIGMNQQIDDLKKGDLCSKLIGRILSFIKRNNML